MTLTDDHPFQIGVLYLTFDVGWIELWIGLQLSNPQPSRRTSHL